MNMKEFLHTTNPKNWSNLADRRFINDSDYRDRLNFSTHLDYDKQIVCKYKSNYYFIVGNKLVFRKDSLKVEGKLNYISDLYIPRYNYFLSKLYKFVLRKRINIAISKMGLEDLLICYDFSVKVGLSSQSKKCKALIKKELETNSGKYSDKLKNRAKYSIMSFREQMGFK